MGILDLIHTEKVYPRLNPGDFRPIFQERNPKYDVCGLYLVKIDRISSINLNGISLHTRVFEKYDNEENLVLDSNFYAVFDTEVEARAWAASVAIGLD